ncbi:hypothetical protein ZEAMMB73_Zm00001d001826 [Zea mays]|uniref:Fiber protein Fb34 n=1 Tax=Zea mays TaxID=4577 RepID=A0A1D6DT62_MAIZE|nr:hypothetical protein ZEAMMB73_Zm00001d001826 [Zea mays]
MASIIVIAAVLVLDVLAFVLAIGAERRRSYVRVTDHRLSSINRSDASTAYGVSALLLLLAAQAVAMVATRCFCCGRALSPGRWRAWSGICFIVCWVTFVIAELCLLAGSVRNAYHTKYFPKGDGPPPCAMLRKGVFAAGAAFTFLAALFAELHYLFYARARDAAAAVAPPIVGGIGMTRM